MFYKTISEEIHKLGILMEDIITAKGKLKLVNLWNENRKSDYEVVKNRAIKMLLGAFDTPEQMIQYFKYNNIEYNNE